MSDITTHHLFVIEYNNEARKEGSENKRELKFIYQTSSSIHDANTTDFHVNSKEFKNGKTILVLEQNGTPITTLYFTFITQNPAIVVNYIFKYYSIATIADLHPIPSLNSISSIRRGNVCIPHLKQLSKTQQRKKSSSLSTWPDYTVRLTSQASMTWITFTPFSIRPTTRGTTQSLTKRRSMWFPN